MVKHSNGPHNYFSSSFNKTTTPLNSGETYTGEWELNGYPAVGVSCHTDQSGKLYFDFSNDEGENVNTFPVNGFDISAGIHEFHTAVKLPRSFRIRFVNNSGSNQTYLRIYTYFGVGFMPSNTPINQSISSDNDAIVVRVGNDQSLDVARGFIGGQSGVSKFGANPSISSSSTEDIIFTGVINFLQTATTVRVKAGNTNDSSSGTGARKVLVVGLDENWEEVSEELTTNGTSASTASTTTFIRIFRAYVTDVGIYGGANAADVVIENGSGGTDLITIESGIGQTQISLYTVPLGKTGYLTRVRVGSTSAKASDISLWQRRNADDITSPFTGKRLVRRFLGVTGSRVVDFSTYPSFPAKTDIWGSVTTGSGAAGSVEMAYDLILVDD